MITQIPDMNYFSKKSPTPPERGITPAPSDQQQIPGEVFAKTAEKTEEEPGVSDSPKKPLVGTAF